MIPAIPHTGAPTAARRGTAPVPSPLLRRARVELPLHTVEAGLEQRSLGQVRVARGVDGAVLEAAAAGDAYEAGAVLPAVVLVDRCPEAEVPETLVRVHRRRRDRAQAPIVVEDPAHELEPDLGELRRPVGVVEDVRPALVDEREVVVGTVGGHAGERLRHEGGDDTVLARDGGADLAVGRQVVGGPDRAVEEEVQLELARRVFVIAVGRVEAEPLAVVDHVENDLPELLELIDVVEPRLRDALGLVRVFGLLEPHHLGLDPAQERVAELLLDLVHDPLQVLARVGLEQLPGLRVVAIAEDPRDPGVPRKRPERVDVRDGGELGLLRPEADVAVLLVHEEVGGRAVDELVAGFRDPLPLRRRDALPIDVPGDRDLLEEDVLDPVFVDVLADLVDLLSADVIVPFLLERRVRICDRALREHLLDLGRTLVDDCHLRRLLFSREGLWTPRRGVSVARGRCQVAWLDTGNGIARARMRQWTINTSQCAWCETDWLTLWPSSRSRTFGSRVPTTIRSAFVSSATVTIVSAGSPTAGWNSASTLRPPRYSRACASSARCFSGGSVGSTPPMPRVAGISRGETLVTISREPNASARSAARSSA